MSFPFSSSTNIKSPPSSGDFIGVGQHFSASKRSRSGRNRTRTLITALVVVLAYLSGVITGILSILSMTATTSVQRDTTSTTTTPGLRILSPLSLLTLPTTTTMSETSSTTTSSLVSSSSESTMLNTITEENQRLREEKKQHQKLRKDLEQQVRQLKQQHQQQQQTMKHESVTVTVDKELPLFPDTVQQMVVDYATVPRDDFNQILDVGVPYDDTKDKKGVGGEEVLLLYTTPAALPSVHSKTNKFGLNATEAMENCNVVKVILHRRHDHRRKHVRQCIALVPNWDSYYVHNFQRLAPQVSNINIPGERLLPPGEPVNAKYPLRYTSRNHDDDGLTYELVPRTDWYTRPYYRVLSNYLQNFDRILDEVQSFIKKHITMHDKTTTMNKKQTLVVMTVNKGQSVLFHNFICHARKNGLDLSHVIMFATDETAQQLCHDLGIPAFYDEAIYGDIPEESAHGYGDSTFGKIMLAKVICVHLILYSGYNVLFQDVDVVWFKVRRKVIIIILLWGEHNI
jgi:Nucleotide-diphospho-sugar transferase